MASDLSHSISNGANSIAKKDFGSIETRLFINGQFINAAGGKKFDIYNPATENFVASVHEAQDVDVELAVDAAEAAFLSWSERGALERASFFYKLAHLLEQHVEEFNMLDAVCMGTPVSSNNEAMFSASLLRYYAGKGVDVQGEASLNIKGFVNLSFRQPYGVCAAIIPWNGPVTLVTFKLAPALISGNTIVIKSSEKAPLSCLLYARLVKEAGFPPGVINFISGFGVPCGHALALHVKIRKISFTGSERVGREIQKASAMSNLKNVTLELGGKSLLIVFEDADMDKAAQWAAQSIIYNSGQICVASSRVFVQASVAETFTKLFKEKITSMGANPASGNDPLSKETRRGPQVEKIQRDNVTKFLTESREAGHQHIAGGNQDAERGYSIQPTLISSPGDQSNVMRNEIFKPVVCLNTFQSEEEVLVRASKTEFSLYASVFTRDFARGLRVAKRFETGTVGVNCASPTMAIDMPFGGYKASGEGHELSKHSLNAWTERKSVLIATG